MGFSAGYTAPATRSNDDARRHLDGQPHYDESR
jgi:hypothetical protein